MAYFPNGTSFAHWVAENCDECLNYRDNGSGSFGCAIADAHFVFDYHEGADILNSLISEDAEHKCAMRLTSAMLEAEERERNYRLDLERYETAMSEARAA